MAIRCSAAEEGRLPTAAAMPATAWTCVARQPTMQIGQFVGDVLERLGEVSTDGIPEQLSGLVQQRELLRKVKWASDSRFAPAQFCAAVGFDVRIAAHLNCIRDNAHAGAVAAVVAIVRQCAIGKIEHAIKVGGSVSVKQM